jgi:prepilin-type N-terminal cleavage/methylation domain-containing protein
MRSPTSRSRVAFTLIELLVVIAIIGVLVALTAAGVMRFMGEGPKMVAKNDINQLSISLELFKNKYKVYPPSAIKLCENRSEYSASAFDQESLTYLVNIWPKLGDFKGIKWGGATNLPAGGVVLDCDQCLVFFLGGIPTVSGGVYGTSGFSVNPINPADTTPDRARFYEFKAGSRLRARVTGSPFPSFYDAYEKQPYLYFSSGRSKNINGGYVAAHGATFGVTPYLQTATKFWNPTTFQIVCAGVDTTFGPGGLWNTSTPATGAGADDFTNFHGSIMGAP